MSKDYRYQREEWDSVEDESFPSKRSAKRNDHVKAKQKRDEQRREKQRRLQSESY